MCRENQDYLNLIDVVRLEMSCTIKEAGFVIASLRHMNICLSTRTYQIDENKHTITTHVVHINAHMH